MVNFKEAVAFKQTSDPRINKVKEISENFYFRPTHFSAFVLYVLKHLKPQVGLLMLPLLCQAVLLFSMYRE
jgi:hypothetical protein